MIAKTKFNRRAKNQIRKISISRGKSQRLKTGEQRQRRLEKKHKIQHQNKRSSIERKWSNKEKNKGKN